MQKGRALLPTCAQSISTSSDRKAGNTPVLNFGGGNPATLTMDLLFDTDQNAKRPGPPADVRTEYINKLRSEGREYAGAQFRRRKSCHADDGSVVRHISECKKAGPSCRRAHRVYQQAQIGRPGIRRCSISAEEILPR